MASSQRNQFKSDDQRSGTWTAQRKTRQNVQSNKSVNHLSFLFLFILNLSVGKEQAHFHFAYCCFSFFPFHRIGVHLFWIGGFSQNYCSFCKNNGELEQTYLSHDLKDSMKRVQCPRLRAYTCKRCGATGDNAHTIRYCPVPQQALATESVHARQQSW